jgi:PAS domain S-box-containing protein
MAELTQEQSLRILDHISDAALLRDLDDKVLYMNRAAEELYEISSEKAVGQKLESLLPKFYEGSRLKMEQETLQHGHWTSKHMGKVGSMESHWYLQKNAAGKPEAFLILNRDLNSKNLTKKILAEANLKEEALRKLNKELERFIHISSHDLKEPLRMIIAYTQLLARELEGNISPEAKEHFGYVQSGAKRMYGLIEDLLAYSRLGREEDRTERVDCSSVLMEVLGNLSVPIKESNVQIHLGDLPEIQANRMELTQLFQNLISNSIKFRSEKRPTILVKAVDKGDHWLFSVKDNGIGIDSIHSEKIFEIFKRLHSRAHYPGNGIGLAICKKIVERYGGKIWVNSKPGETVFFFTLPKPSEIPLERQIGKVG